METPQRPNCGVSMLRQTLTLSAMSVSDEWATVYHESAILPNEQAGVSLKYKRLSRRPKTPVWGIWPVCRRGIGGYKPFFRFQNVLFPAFCWVKMTSGKAFDDTQAPVSGAVDDDNWSEIVVQPEFEKMRIDSFLASQLPDVSRSRINSAMRRGLVLSENRKLKPSEKLKSGAVVRFSIPSAPPAGPIPENVPLEIIYEDEFLAVVNKPTGMVVHPARGHWSGTLTSALAFHFSNLSSVGGSHRPGIVHRLDRDTSGVILAAKTDEAHACLTTQFQNRTIEKEYLAVVSPPPNRDRDEINRSIGVHPYQREKMMIRDDHPSSREASTFYEVRQRAGRFSIVSAFPRTGRTHQIRVHLASIGSPVLADRLYSGRSWAVESEFTGRLADTTRVIERQALHARRIRFRHPRDGEWVEFLAPIPADIARVISLMELHNPKSD